MSRLATRTMKAYRQPSYGPLAQIQLAEFPVPEPGDGEVLVRVAAAGVDPSIWHLMLGQPYMVRLMFGLRAPKRPIPGGDFAGVIEAVGAGVEGWEVGERVAGMAQGTFTQYLTVKADSLARVPDGVALAAAAALPVSGVTAADAMRVAGVGQGQRVAVLGAGGGVGCYAVQLAVQARAEVTAVCSAAKTDFVTDLGASRTIDYTVADVAPTDGPFDVVLEMAGSRPLGQLRRLLTRDGRLLLIGAETERPELIGVTRMLQAAVISPFVSQKLAGLMSEYKAEVLTTLLDDVAAGRLVAPVDRVFGFDEAIDAVQYVRDGRPLGKVVVSVDA